MHEPSKVFPWSHYYALFTTNVWVINVYLCKARVSTDKYCFYWWFVRCTGCTPTNLFAWLSERFYVYTVGIPSSGGSRISRRGGVDLVRGAVDPRGGYVSKILHVKMKESGPVGGGRAGRAPLDPPMPSYRILRLSLGCDSWHATTL